MSFYASCACNISYIGMTTFFVNPNNMIGCVTKRYNTIKIGQRQCRVKQELMEESDVKSMCMIVYCYYKSHKLSKYVK